ncbi:MAG TPA: DUF72 domain-containing protein [Candidatus Krumholzibacteria bacterium]|nr:DUF72 domain-containing protein [Candidatus Krumholzibacteria bacterium]
MSNELHDKIKIGPAGWDYPDWDGIFYPATRKRNFDALAYIASYFTLLEINSTFYRVPAPHVTRRWVERVADRPHFMFTLKAHQSLTHQGDDGTPAELVPLCHAIDPIAQAGRLGAVLLQFPWSFRFDDEARRHVDARIEELRPYPLALEVRHGSWETPEATSYLAGLNITVCGIDQPVMGDSLHPYHYRSGPAGAYFRFHGRNYRNWFAEGAGRDARYDYLYQPEELSPWAAVIQKAAAETGTAHVILNNHFRGQAPANAFELAFLLSGTKPAAPERLRRAYPRLNASTVAGHESGDEPTLFDS